MAKKADFRKCQYSHCKHDDKTISIATEEYAEENGRYYHADCKHEKDTRAEIIDYWYKHIDKDVIFNQLVRIIDRLIYKESIDCDYLLWALKKKAKFLNHPPGLVYVAKDKQLRKEWDFEQKLRAFNETKTTIPTKQNDEPSFTYNESDGKKKFGDIFGGK